jgi:O-antigen/teichoic acid export membrane protein
MLGNALILLGGQSFSAIFNLGYLALAVRALGTDTFGLLVMIHAYTALVGELGKFQSWQAVLRYGTPALEEERIGDFQRLIRFTALLDLASAIAITVVAAGGVFLVAPLMDWPREIVPIAALYCLSLLFIASATPIGLLRLFDRFDLMAIQVSVEALVRLVGAAVALAFGWGLPLFVLIWFVGRMVSGAALASGAIHELRRRGLAKGLFRGLPGMPGAPPGIWRFVLNTNFIGTAEKSMTHFMPLVVGALLGASEAGLLRIAERVARVVAKPLRLLIPTIYPEIARLVASGKTSELRRLLVRSAVVSGAVALLAVVVLVLAGQWLLRLIGGAETAAVHDLMVLLGLASLLLVVSFPLEPTLVSIGRAGAALRVQLLAVALHIALLLALTEALGLIAAGFAAVSAALVGVVARLILVVRWFRQGHPRVTGG